MSEKLEKKKSLKNKKQQTIDQKLKPWASLLVVLIGLIIVSSGLTQFFLSPKRVGQWFQNNLDTEHLPFEVYFEQVQTSFTGNFLQPLGIKFKNTNIESLDECLLIKTVKSKQTLVPVSLLKLVNKKLDIGVIKIPELYFSLSPRTENCDFIKYRDSLDHTLNFFKSIDGVNVLNFQTLVNDLLFFPKFRVQGPFLRFSYNKKDESIDGRSTIEKIILDDEFERDVKIKLGFSLLGESYFFDFQGKDKEGDLFSSFQYKPSTTQFETKVKVINFPLHHYFPVFLSNVNLEKAIKSWLWLTCDLSVDGMYSSDNKFLNINKCEAKGKWFKSLKLSPLKRLPLNQLVANKYFRVKIEEMDLKILGEVLKKEIVRDKKVSFTLNLNLSGDLSIYNLSGQLLKSVKVPNFDSYKILKAIYEVY